MVQNIMPTQNDVANSNSTVSKDKIGQHCRVIEVHKRRKINMVLFRTIQTYWDFLIIDTNRIRRPSRLFNTKNPENCAKHTNIPT